MLRRLLLERLLVGDDLDDAVPDLVGDLRARRLDQLQHHVDVPARGGVAAVT